MDVVAGEGGLLLLLLCLLFPVCFSAFQLHRKRRQLPPGPAPWLFLGNILQKDVFPLYSSYEKLMKKYGPIFTVWKGTKPIVVLCGYEVVKDALVDHSEEFLGRPVNPFIFRILKGHGFPNIKGEKWRQLRQFTHSTLRDLGVGKKIMSERIQEEAVCLVEEIADTKGQAFDPRRNVLSASCNVICSIVFGTQFEYKDPAFQEQLKIIGDIALSFRTFFGMIYNTFPKIMDLLPGPHKKVQSDGRKLSSCIQERVEAHRQTLDPQNPRDYIDYFLIKIKKEQDSAEAMFRPEGITPCALDLISAASTTTSQALLYSLFVMAKLPLIQAKVQEEIDAVVGGSRAPGMEDQMRLPFTNAVIHEILRYQKTDVENLPRETTCHTVFRGFNIPQYTTIVPLLPSVHFDPLHWETPDEFNPGHFLDEKGKLRTRDAFMPFFTGKRSCLGAVLARTELFLFFSTVFQNFTFQLVTDNTERDLPSSFAAYRRKNVYPLLRAIKRSM